MTQRGDFSPIEIVDTQRTNTEERRNQEDTYRSDDSASFTVFCSRYCARNDDEHDAHPKVAEHHQLPSPDAIDGVEGHESVADLPDIDCDRQSARGNGTEAKQFLEYSCSIETDHANSVDLLREGTEPTPMDRTVSRYLRQERIQEKGQLDPREIPCGSCPF